MSKAKEIQKKYYEQTATDYDEAHAHDAEHDTALRFIQSFCEMLQASSLLDVGCGTGRGVNAFIEKYPRWMTVGIEPVQALLQQAVRRNVPGKQALVCGSGECLPFADDSFDVVCEFAILHHVKNPGAVVNEMTRVARKAVFLSDANRFGQGRMPARIVKLLLYKLRLWGVVNWLRTRGKGYSISANDGLFYSYSVYDSYAALAAWADTMILIPTKGRTGKSWFHPLLTADQILVCAFKQDPARESL